ncbi:Protein CBG08466 [Caenorhabditis briggsae]|uniref:NTF2-like domain-containing protein n=2 Tax=Caenorhabditis briggsae TaxID=6238 RepID=A0AAE9J0N4_CAEBR|nr:Protein CBG08466 [Caenorhabditis briggsae]ULU13365.1 hypothetical protein L3Y34_016097 [Caenorhabditis briggsae]CAP28283.1 Protein CBG08466 [Caenorhabditis briggsae]
MSPSILVICLLAGTSWAFVPDDPDLRGTDSFGGHPNDIFYFTRNVFAPSSDTAKQVVEKFLARMIRSLESGDVDVISGLFQPGFVFKGCKGTYDKSQIIGLLSQIPSGTKFTLSLQSVFDTGSSIKYTVVASGLRPASIEANFVLNKVDQQLECGEIPACQKHSFLTFKSVQNPTEEEVKRFLARMTRSIESKDASIINDLFEPGFIFHGCKGNHSKQAVVNWLSTLPPGVKFTYTITDTIKLTHIGYYVDIAGIKEYAIKTAFVLDKFDQKLKVGYMMGCPKKQRSFLGFYQPEDSNDVVQRFLSSMKETIDSHEPALIGKLFDDAFIFKGCHGTYTKAQAIAKLTSFPSGASFNFSLVTSKWNSQGQIEYTVSVSVPRMDSFKGQFVYCPHKNVLKSASIEHCAARRFSVFY